MNSNKNYQSDALPAFDWNRAKNFYYIAKLGSFTKAAKFLSTSQPGLSRQVQLLENELNVILLNRTARGVILTRKGQELYDLVESYFLSLKGYRCNHRAMNGDGKKRRIRISTTHAIATYILNKHLLEFNSIHPNIIFDVVTDDQLIDLVLNDVDISIRPYDHTVKGIVQEPLFTLQKKLFASSQYLTKYGEPKSVMDLKNHRIVAPSEPQRYPYSDVLWILSVGQEPGHFHEPVYTSNSLECLIQAAQAGAGILAGYPEMEIVRNAGLLPILPCAAEEPSSFCLTYPNFMKEDEEFLGIRNFLKQQLS